MNFMAVICPVNFRRPLYTCSGVKQKVQDVESYSLSAATVYLSCQNAQDIGIDEPQYKAYLAKAALTNQINNMVVFHGHPTQPEDALEVAGELNEILSVE